MAGTRFIVHRVTVPGSCPVRVYYGHCRRTGGRDRAGAIENHRRPDPFPTTPPANARSCRARNKWYATGERDNKDLDGISLNFVRYLSFRVDRRRAPSVRIYYRATVAAEWAEKIGNEFTKSQPVETVVNSTVCRPLFSLARR